MEDAADNYNDGYTHEVLHTTHIIMDMLHSHVIETRSSVEFPDVHKAAQKASRALFDLYQLIGTKFVDDCPTDSSL